MSELMSLDEIKWRLKDVRLYAVAEETGLSYPTIKKMADGNSDAFALSSIKVISEYLGNRINYNEE